jgi:REP-associated tyrosine transposase
MNEPLSNRRSIRLKKYDYSQCGYYFITICAQNREHLFGEIISDRKMKLNNAGEMIQTIWNKIPEYYPNILTDAFVVMPNHIHGIINTVGADSISARTDPEKRAEMDSAPTLGAVVQMFKRYSTIEYIKMVKQHIVPAFSKRIWQRNYWEHIVRNENELNCIRDYIRSNPHKWETDKLNGGASNVVMEPSVVYGDESWMN